MLLVHHGVPTPHAIAMSELSDFFLIEAGEYIDNDIYAGWCRQQSLLTSGKHVVLDNGVGIGEPVGWDAVLQVSNYLDAGFVVLPDVLYNKDATLRNAREAISKSTIHRGLAYTLVIQGNSEKELLECWDEVLTSDLCSVIGCIGIPFRMWPGSPNHTRSAFVRTHIQPYIGDIDKPIHLFGCRYVGDFTLTCCDFIDTRYAFKHAVMGHSIIEQRCIPNFKNTMVMSSQYSPWVCQLATHNAEYLNSLRDMSTKTGGG